MEHTVIHDEKVNRFEVFESGQIAYLQYEEKDGVLDILHTMVPPQLEGMGIAADLTTAAARYAEINQLKIKLVHLQKHISYVIRNTGIYWYKDEKAVCWKSNVTITLVCF